MVIEWRRKNESNYVRIELKQPLEAEEWEREEKLWSLLYFFVASCYVIKMSLACISLIGETVTVFVMWVFKTPVLYFSIQKMLNGVHFVLTCHFCFKKRLIQASEKIAPLFNVLWPMPLNEPAFYAFVRSVLLYSVFSLPSLLLCFFELLFGSSMAERNYGTKGRKSDR